MRAGGWERVFLAGGRVRSGWRILLFAVIFLLILSLTAPLSRLGPASLAGTLFRDGALTLIAALGAGWILLAGLDRRSPGALGFAWTRRTVREIALGGAIGVLALATIVVLFVAVGWVSYQPEPGTAGGYLRSLAVAGVVIAVAAAAEEALFRGYAFQSLVEGIGATPATVLASAAFAAAHARNPNVTALALGNIFLAGVLLSAAYLRTRSLWFASALHAGWNWAMASLFDLPVSGLGAFNTPLYAPVVGGAAWVTGGGFGPEGGIGGSVALLLALAAVFRLRGVREGDEMRELRPLVDGVRRGGEGDDGNP